MRSVLRETAPGEHALVQKSDLSRRKSSVRVVVVTYAMEFEACRSHDSRFRLSDAAFCVHVV